MAADGLIEMNSTVSAILHVRCTALLRNFISFYYQAYRAAVWYSRQNYLLIVAFGNMV
jgi:hypothetical protein